MAIRKIVYDTDDLLRKKSREVTEFDEKLWDLLDDMAETMHKNNGVGLAAPQVGILRRVCVIDVGAGVMELVNPEIVRAVGEQTGQEGCLSSPDMYAPVTRANDVTVKAQNRYGKNVMFTGKELLARAFCHEIDHLNGILFADIALESPHKVIED